jgi:hypothetical protein
MEFHIYLFVNFHFQYKPKANIMLNSMLPLVGIMKITKIMRIIQYQIQEKTFGCKVWFSGLKYTKTCFFHMKQNVEI